MSFFKGPTIVRESLELALDAASLRSYPGSGTTWYDISGNGSHLTLNSASTWVSNGAASYMNFESGIAKYLPGGYLTTIPGTTSGTGTICIFSTVKAPDGDWKTLVRGTPADPDHQVIIYSNDGISLGMYDNDAGGFQDTGFDMNTLPNYTSQFNFMVWKFADISPYYQFYYNNNLSSPQATLTTSYAAFNSGFSCIGGYHDGSNSPTVFSQEFGKISVFLYYSKHLTTAELEQNYNALRGRFGL